MKTDANWTSRLGYWTLMLALAFAMTSCGGNGSNSVLEGSNQQVSVTPGGESSGMVTVHSAEEIASLPADQQALLTDPGWNQPYITPDEGVSGLPAPSTEELLRLTRERLEQGDVIVPRGADVEAVLSGAKGASYVGQGSAAYNNVNPPYGGANNVPNFDPTGITVLRGEYYQFTKSATPTYGCNADGSNIGNRDIGPEKTAIEDTIVQYNLANLGEANQAICYVLEAITTKNWFNTGGGTGGAGTGGNARCAIYQLFAKAKTSVPAAPKPDDVIAEISFRSDLTQYGKGPGQGVGPGGTQCYTGPMVAHGVSGAFWKAFNKVNTALPNSEPPMPNYQILIAPADEAVGVGSASADYETTDLSRLVYQRFYFGSQNLCYGGAWIVGLTGTNSGCTTYKNIFTTDATFFFNPVYGAVLKKWLSMAPASAPNFPWKGALGAPVFGPVAYNNGAATNEPGKKWYAWGWYFERGFMWYVDNDQAVFPNTPDEAHVYLYSGNNTYCTGGTYTLVNPKSFYLAPNATTFKVNVAIDGYSKDDTTYTTPTLNATTGRYEIPLYSIDATTEGVWVAVSAAGYGGTPDANCQYTNYIYAWRDGSITSAGPAEKAKHFYTGPKTGPVNKQSVYVVRVQCRDSVGALAYGDSTPFELGTVLGGILGDVLVVRNDASAFAANYNAIIADLASIKAGPMPSLVYNQVDFSSFNLANAKQHRVVIWYRGGSNDTTTRNNQKYTTAELTAIRDIMANPNPVPVLHFTQNMSINDNGGYMQFYSPYFYDFVGNAMPTSGSFNTPNTFLQAAMGSNQYDYVGYTGPMSARNGTSNSMYTMAPGGTSVIGERYTGTGSSGKIPTAYNLFFDLYQKQCTFLPCPATPPSSFGMAATVQLGSWAAGSWCAWTFGNTATTAKTWIYGGPWAGTVVTSSSPAGMQRWEMLQNMLASLNSAIGTPFAAPTFQPYSGVPEILAVTPIQFANNGNVNVGTQMIPGMGYPDTTFAAGFTGNVYRGDATGLPGGHNYVVDTAVRTVAPALDNVLNGNDIQFQFPLYAYVIDPNGSVGANGTGSLSGDETISYGGLLVENGTGANQWTRCNPTAVGHKPWHTGATPMNGTLAANLRKPAAGYYVNSNPGAGFAGTVRADYGNSNAQLLFDNAAGPMSYEAIAHWSGTLTYGAAPATVRWRLWPGHGVDDRNNPGNYYGEGNTFASKWITDVDIDPSVPGTLFARTGSAFNMSDFNFIGQTAGGRVAEFNYSTLKGWDGDIDRDNNRGEDPDDKFPVSCRVFSNYTGYLGYFTNGWTFPNNVPDPSTYVEGGCYVVDTGQPVQGITVTDDGNAANNPHTQVTYVSGTTWNVGLSFNVVNTSGAFTLQVNTNYPGGTWTAMTADQPQTGDGTYTKTLAVTQPAGTYTIGLRATDVNGTSPNFFWPTPVVLATPLQTVVIDDPLDNAAGGNNSHTNIMADLTALYGAGGITVIPAPPAGTGFTAAQQASILAAKGIFWCSDAPFASFSYTGPSNGNFSLAAGDPKIATLNSAVAAGAVIFYAGGGSFRLQQQGIWPSGTYLPFPNGTWWMDGDSTPNYFFSTIGTAPNNISDGSTTPGPNTRGYNTARAGAIGVVGCIQNVSGSPVNFMRGYYSGDNFYAAGAYRTTGLGSVIQLLLNYGDLGSTQMGVARHLYLENMLCLGNPASQFNSPLT